MATKAVQRVPRLGKKQVFLPNFVLTLIRTPALPPTFASFIVPLELNKLDLRDYLYNAYGVRVKGVRSFIQQQKKTINKPGPHGQTIRKWYRARSIKKMMVELERPFVWPEEPEDFAQWDKDVYKAAQEDQEAYSRGIQRPNREPPAMSVRKSIAEQAKQLLSGEEKWQSTKSEWINDGPETEVDEHLQLPEEEVVGKMESRPEVETQSQHSRA